MLLIDFINNVYGTQRGSRKAFLDDHPHIEPQELTRWIKNRHFGGFF